MFWRAAIISGWGEKPQSMESKKKCNLFAVERLSWTVLKYWSRWVLKQWVFWHFHILGSEELGYVGSDMDFYLPKCRVFYNKFVLQSKVAGVLLCKGYHLHIIHLTGLYRTFSGCGILQPSLCRDRYLTRCARDERNCRSLLSYCFPSTWGKTSVYEVAVE